MERVKGTGAGANREFQGKLWAGEVQKGENPSLCMSTPGTVLETELQLAQGLIQFPGIILYFRGKTRRRGGKNQCEHFPPNIVRQV